MIMYVHVTCLLVMTICFGDYGFKKEISLVTRKREPNV